MALTIEQVRHVARLARLQMSEDEMQRMIHHLQEMVDVFDGLNRLDTEGLEPTSHSVPVHNVWRDDVAAPFPSSSAILEGSAQSRDALFIVPAILEDD